MTTNNNDAVQVQFVFKAFNGMFWLESTDGKCTMIVNEENSAYMPAYLPAYKKQLYVVGASIHESYRNKGLGVYMYITMMEKLRSVYSSYVLTPGKVASEVEACTHKSTSEAADRVWTSKRFYDYATQLGYEYFVNDNSVFVAC